VDEPLTHVTAGYRTRCPWCADYIEEGDAIVCVEGEWVHREDAEDEGLEVV